MRIISIAVLLSINCIGYSQDLSENLLIHYPFDGNFLDVSNNLYHGENHGAVFMEDRFGNTNSAIYFDGIDDHIIFPNLKELKPELPVSFSFWIRYDSENTNDRGVFNTSYENDRSTGVTFNASSATGGYAINVSDGDYSYNPGSRRTLVSNKAIETGEWHHIAVIVNSITDMRIYVDCEDPGGNYSGTGGTLVYSDSPGNLGRYDNTFDVDGKFFHGRLDEFRYWNHAITFDEVFDLCNESIDYCAIAMPIETSPFDTLVCEHASIILDANTPGGIYRWNTGANTPAITVSSSGAYTVEVTNRCDTILFNYPVIRNKYRAIPELNFPIVSFGHR